MVAEYIACHREGEDVARLEYLDRCMYNGLCFFMSLQILLEANVVYFLSFWVYGYSFAYFHMLNMLCIAQTMHIL